MTGFQVWAPAAGHVRLRLDDLTLAMRRDPDGWWRVDVPAAAAVADYAFLLDDDDTPRPDPRSAWQPHGVHGPSRTYDHAEFGWTDPDWRGRALAGSVIYELHIGTFTEAGTFDAAIERLDHLADLGVDLVELLPVNALNGRHNWGYDGVCWFAPHEAYGGPDGLKRFVDACHHRGLGVIIDAVYNHFGPSGAYAPMFGPYLSQRETSWGRSVNLDGPDSDEVRRCIIDSALAWLRDYHADGLRLDAVHALVDTSATHLLEELAAEVEALATHLRRPLTLIAESDLNDARLITSRQAGGYGLHAQWNDDAHHALHVLLTNEQQGYYADFADPDAFADVWQGAFFHAGTYSTFRGRRHGRPVDRSRVSGHQFVAYLQNHDQIGNRATGDRLTATLSADLLKVGATLLFTGPFTPMIFMGEEWGAQSPWAYFTSHPEPDLADAVVAGRTAEFAAHGWPPDRIPDPQDPGTFDGSRLDWNERDKAEHADLLAFHRDLIGLRRRFADLSDPRLDRVRVERADGCLIIHRGRHLVVANLSAKSSVVRLPAPVGPGDRPEWTVVFSTWSPALNGGHRIELPPRSASVLAPSPDTGGRTG